MGDGQYKYKKMPLNTNEKKVEIVSFLSQKNIHEYDTFLYSNLYTQDLEF